MPPLQRAVALPEVHDVAMAIGENLHLDVPRLLDVFFQVDAAVLEGLLRLLAGRIEARLETDVIVGDAHAAAATAGRRLDQDRETQRVRQFQRLGIGLDQALAARHNRHSGLLGQLAGLILVAQAAHGFVRRTDELDPARTADLGEVGILGQKAIARMNRLDVGNFGGADDARNVEVAIDRRRRADADRLVSQSQVRSVAVGFAENGDHLHAQIAAGANHSQSNFTAVRYQNALKHSSQ